MAISAKTSDAFKERREARSQCWATAMMSDGCIMLMIIASHAMRSSEPASQAAGTRRPAPLPHRAVRTDQPRHVVHAHGLAGRHVQRPGAHVLEIADGRLRARAPQALTPLTRTDTPLECQAPSVQRCERRRAAVSKAAPALHHRHSIRTPQHRQRGAPPARPRSCGVTCASAASASSRSVYRSSSRPADVSGPCGRHACAAAPTAQRSAPQLSSIAGSPARSERAAPPCLGGSRSALGARKRCSCVEAAARGGAGLAARRRRARRGAGRGRVRGARLRLQQLRVQLLLKPAQRLRHAAAAGAARGGHALRVAVRRRVRLEQHQLVQAERERIARQLARLARPRAAWRAPARRVSGHTRSARRAPRSDLVQRATGPDAGPRLALTGSATYCQAGRTWRPARSSARAQLHVLEPGAQTHAGRGVCSAQLPREERKPEACLVLTHASARRPAAPAAWVAA